MKMTYNDAISLVLVLFLIVVGLCIYCVNSLCEEDNIPTHKITTTITDATKYEISTINEATY